MPKVQTSFEDRIARLEKEHASGRANTPKMLAGVENSTPELPGKKNGKRTHGGSLIRSFVKTFAVAILCLGGAGYMIENKQSVMAAVGPYLLAGFDFVSESELASLSDEQRAQFEAFIYEISGTQSPDEIRKAASETIRAQSALIAGHDNPAELQKMLDACIDVACISHLVQSVKVRATQPTASN